MPQYALLGLTLLCWLGNGIFWCPPKTVNAQVDAGTAKVERLAPVGKALGFSFDREEVVLPGISRLFCRSSPSAVSGFVVPVSINAVNARSGRSLSHILEEPIELKPLVANPDSFSIVEIGPPSSFFGTARLHVLPRPIGGTISKAVSFIGRLSVAPTANNPVFNEVRGRRERLFSAIALNKPYRRLIIRPPTRKEGEQLSESLTRDVNGVSVYRDSEVRFHGISFASKFITTRN